METSNPIPLHSQGITEDQLEALIARYTLEYLYQWTNEFDAAQLAELKKLLETDHAGKTIVKMLKISQSELPS